MNGTENSLIEDRISFWEPTSELNSQHRKISKAYVADGRLFGDAILRDRIDQCAKLKNAQINNTLVKRIDVIFGSEVRVIKSPSDLQNKYEELGGGDRVLLLPKGERLKSLIRQNASCIEEFDGHGFSRIVAVKPGGDKLCK